MTHTAHGIECTYSDGSLPCSFGASGTGSLCEFSLDANDLVQRTGSCPQQGGTLYLNSRRIKGLREDVFDNMGAVERLYLDGNELASLPSKVFTGLISLTRLYLHGNELINLSERLFTGLTRLELLSLYQNKLTSLPDTVFTSLTRLQTLNLHNNKLVSLSVSIFSGLTSLTVLGLHGNELRSLPAPIFTPLTRLTELYVRCTPYGLAMHAHARFYYCAAESDNAALTCVPLTQARMARLAKYYGPLDSCEVECPVGLQGEEGDNFGWCSPCASGTFKGAAGSDACAGSPCTAGTYGPVGSTSAATATCSPCPASTYSATEGAGECTNCPRETWSAAVGAASETSCTPCPGDTVSDEGSDEESDCKEPPTETIATTEVALSSEATHVVKLSLLLPLSKAEFGRGKQANFKKSIATAARVSPGNVTIDNMEDYAFARRRLLASGLRIDVSLKAKDKEAADDMSAELTVGNINAELYKNGFSQAEMLAEPSTTVVDFADSGGSKKGGVKISPVLIIGGVAGAVVLILAANCCWRRRLQNNSHAQARQSESHHHIETDIQADVGFPSPEHRFEDTQKEQVGIEGTKRKQAAKLGFRSPERGHRGVPATVPEHGVPATVPEHGVPATVPEHGVPVTISTPRPDVNMHI